MLNPFVARLSNRGTLFVLDQAVRSAGSAAALLAASVTMPQPAFNTYSLLQFAAVTLPVLAAAFVWTPAQLIRSHPGQPVASLHRVFGIAVAGFAAVFPVIALSTSFSALQSLVCSLSLALVTMQAGLSVRALTCHREVRALTSDSGWAALAVAGFLALHPQDPVTAVAILGAASVAASVPLLVRLPGEPVGTIPALVSSGAQEAAPITLGLAANWSTLLIVNAMVADAQVGDYRLALSLAGPVLLLSGAVAGYLIKDAASHREAWQRGGRSQLAARLRKYRLQVGGLSLPYLLFVYLPLGAWATGRGSGFLFFVAGAAVAIIRVWTAPATAAIRITGNGRSFLRIRLVQLGIAVACFAVALGPLGLGQWALVAYLLAGDVAGLVLWRLGVRSVYRQLGADRDAGLASSTPTESP